MNSTATGRREHWDEVYSTRAEDQVSWYQADPEPSVELVTAAADGSAGKGTAIIDAGGGTSQLAHLLAAAGYTDVTVADVSAAALAAARARPGGDRIAWVQADLLGWRPQRTYQVWHDRAVFHFLTSPRDRAAYLATLRAALPGGGTVILATFAADGPEYCSGLPVARYAPADLAAELTRAYGDAVSITGRRSQQHRTPAGTVQPFTWITAQLRRGPARRAV
jgi:SAM-dependent methyltransferase